MLHDRRRQLPEVRHEMDVIPVVSVLSFDYWNIVELLFISEPLHAPKKRPDFFAHIGEVPR